jgi:hypothetical protein
MATAFFAEPFTADSAVEQKEPLYMSFSRMHELPRIQHKYFTKPETAFGAESMHVSIVAHDAFRRIIQLVGPYNSIISHDPYEYLSVELPTREARARVNNIGRIVPMPLTDD